MEAGGLQRSEISFRRTGSSGLVWDDKFLGELAKIKPAASQDGTDDPEPRRLSSADPATLQRSRSDGGGGSRQGYKTMKAPSPSLDPPSPKVSGCGGICSIFGGGGSSHPSEKQPRSSKRAKVVGKRKV
uniref:MAPK kinase substrate protein n=1 Tax=Kalanchoe fedtschenkoi TaxID=63787 RepID=A0A7N0U4T2_KALFE